MRTLAFLSTALLAAAAGCGDDGNDDTTDGGTTIDSGATADAPNLTDGRVPSGPPVETEPPNAENQTPAFEGQTRAPGDPLGVDFEVETVTDGLEHPWAVAVLPDGQFLVTERPGRLRVVSAAGVVSPAVTGLPAVDARGQGGLLDIALDPDYATNRLIYWSYAEPRSGGNGTAVARGTLTLGANPSVADVEVLWRMTPTFNSTLHFGSRLAFAPDGKLFITTGERSDLAGRAQAQQLNSSLGKIIRIEADGSVPSDNPLVGRKGAQAEIWSWGHRNVQGATIHPTTGELWTTEHGAQGGDEVNIVGKGKDYGWPTISYGQEYSGQPIGDGITAREGMEQPRYYWDPVIAPSGMTFYQGAMFPAWQGSLFVGSLSQQHLDRLTIEGDRIIGEERVLTGRGRIRDVQVGPDGAVYVVTDADNGALLKLVAP
jgi:glucose/arabinose dehydrogenase